MNNAQRKLITVVYLLYAHNGAMGLADFRRAVQLLLDEKIAEVKDEPEPPPSSALDAAKPTQ